MGAQGLLRRLGSARAPGVISAARAWLIMGTYFIRAPRAPTRGDAVTRTPSQAESQAWLGHPGPSPPCAGLSLCRAPGVISATHQAPLIKYYFGHPGSSPPPGLSLFRVPGVISAARARLMGARGHLRRPSSAYGNPGSSPPPGLGSRRPGSSLPPGLGNATHYTHAQNADKRNISLKHGDLTPRIRTKRTQT